MPAAHELHVASDAAPTVVEYLPATCPRAPAVSAPSPCRHESMATCHAVSKHELTAVCRLHSPSPCHQRLTPLLSNMYYSASSCMSTHTHDGGSEGAVSVEGNKVTGPGGRACCTGRARARRNGRQSFRVFACSPRPIVSTPSPNRTLTTHDSSSREEGARHALRATINLKRHACAAIRACSYAQ